MRGRERGFGKVKGLGITCEGKRGRKWKEQVRGANRELLLVANQ